MTISLSKFSPKVTLLIIDNNCRKSLKRISMDLWYTRNKQSVKIIYLFSSESCSFYSSADYLINIYSSIYLFVSISSHRKCKDIIQMHRILVIPLSIYITLRCNLTLFGHARANVSSQEHKKAEGKPESRNQKRRADKSDSTRLFVTGEP